MPRYVSPGSLAEHIGTRTCPHVVDVRREGDFLSAETRIPASRWRDHMETAEWAAEVADRRPVVVYCTHGHNVSEIAAAGLAAQGLDVSILEGGIEAYGQAGGLLIARSIRGVDPMHGPSVWVTRERPKIDRIACPWLIRRFVDPVARFHFVAAQWVGDVAAELGAEPFDVQDVHYSHRGETCTFDTMIAEFGLTDPALDHLAGIVRAADTARLDMEPQAAGLLAVSLGLSAIEPDDLRQLEAGILIYDALYGWCRHATAETHNWPSKVA